MSDAIRWFPICYLSQGKYHCTADLLFVLFGFSCFAYVELASALLVWSYLYGYEIETQPGLS